MKNTYISIKHLLLFPIILGAIILAGCVSNESLKDDKEVLAWTQEALLAVFTYDYANYHQQLEAASQYFIPQTWKFYFTALNASPSLKKVINRQMVVSAVSQRTPTIVSQGVNTNSQSYWMVRVPMLITYENASVHIEKPVIVSVGILRTNNQVGVRGLAINELFVKDQGESDLEAWHSK